ncbi:hypothetical protein F6455_15570 [Proteobacteria bacterium 005FR1]|nr:hypothetical protein [Proteobacteria bacterium 005FR1]
MKKLNRNPGTVFMRGAALGLISSALVLAGCATYTPAPAPAPAPESETGSASRPAPAIPKQEPERAVDRLLEESRSQLAARDWQAAIASAERGLRINRREAELYLLIAEAYRGLGNGDRSVQFARQGLRHAAEGSRTAKALHNLVAAGEVLR